MRDFRTERWKDSLSLKEWEKLAETEVMEKMAKEFKDLVKTAYELYKDNQTNIRFLHIRAHTNNTDIHSIGNDHADKLANMAVV